MKVANVVGIALLLTAAGMTTAAAQEAPIDARATVEVTGDEADRAELSELFARPEVQRAARIGGIDLAGAEERLGSLEGEQLHRAAQQARVLEQHLDAAAQNEIRISTIALIIVLLLVIIIILLA